LSDSATLPIIAVKDLHYIYDPQSAAPIQALQGIGLDVYPGEYLVILGHNGSGKSTLARHLNALLTPTQGEVRVKGLDTRMPGNTLSIRRAVGMVFQVPDNQIVASVVEEDVAFGPENLGVPEAELHERVDWALGVVGMLDYRRREPQRLSAGQKQRVAIAGVMAMKPEVLVLDEATSMLDPEGQHDVLAAVRTLNGNGVTVVAITHFMHEAIEGSRVLVMEAGRIVMEGSPREVFSRVEELRSLQLDVPQTTELSSLLNQRDPAFPRDLLTVDEVANEVQAQVGALSFRRKGEATLTPAPAHCTRDRTTVSLGGEGDAILTPTLPHHARVGDAFIELNELHHTYLRGTPLEVTALHGVSLEVHRGEVVGIIGRTGSGKSTVVQHLNGLIRPRHAGQVCVGGQDLSDPAVDIRSLRQKVGLVFQYPEQQLFERLVGDDIAFGPKKLGMARPERRERVRWAMEMVGLDFEGFRDRYTFSLSGGEMRKVAVAGVLALRPEVLVLDESTSGLDPRSRKDLLGRLAAMHREQGLTLVFVSPSMEDVATLVDRIYVMDQGRVVMSGTAREVFSQAGRLRELGLGVPQVTEVAQELMARGIRVQRIPLTVAEGAEELWRALSS